MARESPNDPDLAHVVEAWPPLQVDVKAKLLLLIDIAASAPDNAPVARGDAESACGGPLGNMAVSRVWRDAGGTPGGQRGASARGSPL